MKIDEYEAANLACAEAQLTEAKCYVAAIKARRAAEAANRAHERAVSAAAKAHEHLRGIVDRRWPRVAEEGEP